ncbi:MAG: hypothetical protein M3146_05090 [Thermoproteota archaeon]|nr:hypothetical protein [Thermoproteota archaeon]
MKNSTKQKTGFAVLVISSLAIASIMWPVIGESEKAVAQSPMDMMNIMTGGGNMTDGSLMMGGGNNMSLPFNMGVLIMPTMCTTPNQLLGSVSGMFGEGITGDDNNATKQMMMGLMQQQMTSMGGMENMTELGGMENMTEVALQQAMNLAICIPIMNEEMMESMMGNGQNSTSSMMSGMMME